MIYVFAYTPLKRISNFNTLVGTVPGALPPLIGWVAARGRIDPGAWSLFTIMVLWQLPHFFAISWMCREDYSRAGFQMISNDDVAAIAVPVRASFSMLLLVVAGLPAFVGVVSQIMSPSNCSRGMLCRRRASLPAETDAPLRAFALSHFYHLPSVAPRRVSPDQVMSTITAPAARRNSSLLSDTWRWILLLFPIVIAAGLFLLRQIEVNALARRSLPDLRNCSPFQLTNQDGKPFGSSQLAGKIWIADFVFTSCRGPCPIISTRMSELQKPLRDSDVHLISFTVDPDTDTPEVLHGYGERLHAQTVAGIF